MPLLDGEGFTPDERERAQTRVQLDQVKKILSSPDWRVFLEYQAETCEALLDKVLYDKPERQQEWLGLLRANLEIARDFGHRDLLIKGHLLNLERQIKTQRGAVRGQLAATYGGEDADQE